MDALIPLICEPCDKGSMFLAVSLRDRVLAHEIGIRCACGAVMKDTTKKRALAAHRRWMTRQKQQKAA